MVYVRGCGSEELFKHKAKVGAARLLALLIEHHDSNLPSPPPPRKIRAARIKVIPINESTLCEKCNDPIFVVDRMPRVQDIKRAATRYFQLHATDLDSHRRTAKIAYSRQVAMYLSRTLSDKSYPEIARRMGGRDHTTAIHAIRKIEGLVKSDWMVAYDVAFLEGVIVGDCSNEKVR